MNKTAAMSEMCRDGLSIRRSNAGRELAGTAFLQFKVGAIVKGIPLWLEAELSPPPCPEKLLCTCEMLRNVFCDITKLLEERDEF